MYSHPFHKYICFLIVVLCYKFSLQITTGMRVSTCLVSILLCYKYVYRATAMNFSMNKYLCIIINVQKHICLCTYSFLCIKILRGDYFIRGVNISPWNIHPGVKISWGWIFNPTPVQKHKVTAGIPGWLNYNSIYISILSIQTVR